jgi:hypothetical protein
MIEESLLSNNFLGRDGFRWWIGRIPPSQSHNDQIKKEGWGNRYKVRIMGYHPLDLGELPDEDLPWAQCLLSTTAGSGAANYATSVKLQPGDTVFGFFLDGDNAQTPVIMGCFGRTRKTENGNQSYKGPFTSFTGYTPGAVNKPDVSTLWPDQTNEQYLNSQKSPRNLDPKTVRKLNKDFLKSGLPPEVTYYSAIGMEVLFANLGKDVGVMGILSEVGNLIGRVSGIPNLGGALNTVSGIASGVASGNISQAIGGIGGLVGGSVGGPLGSILNNAGSIAGAVQSGNVTNIIGAAGGALGGSGLFGSQTSSILNQAGSIAGAVRGGNVSSILGVAGGVVGGNFGSVLGQAGTVIGSAQSGNVSGVLGSLGSLVGGSTGGILSQAGGILSQVGGVTGAISSGNVGGILGSISGIASGGSILPAPVTGLLKEIDSTVSSILGFANGIIGKLFSEYFNALIDPLNFGLNLLYKEIFAKVYAITPGEHAIKFAAAHAAGTAAQIAMIPFVKALQEAIYCKPGRVHSKLEKPIKEILIKGLQNIDVFIECGQEQFTASIVGHIIDRIERELEKEMNGVSKINPKNFNVQKYMRNNSDGYRSVGGFFDCNQDTRKGKGKVNVYKIGYGAKGDYNEDKMYKQIRKNLRAIKGSLDGNNFGTKYGRWPVLEAKTGNQPATANQGPTVIEKRIERTEWVKVDDVFVPPISGRFSVGSRQFQRGQTTFFAVGRNASFHRYNEGTWYKGKQIRSGGDWNDTNVNSNYIKWDKDTRLTLGRYYPNEGQRFGIAVWKKKTATEVETEVVEPLEPCVCLEPEQCNPPEIRIFGNGNGATAVPLMGPKDPNTGASRIVGAIITNSGEGYTSSPQLEFFDNCGNGYGAVGRTIIDEGGRVRAIYMISPGENYPSNYQELLYNVEIYVEDQGENYVEPILIDNFGNIYELEVNGGRIIGIRDAASSEINIVVNDLPELTIIDQADDSNGSGAIVRPVLKPIGRPGGELVQVIDCIT